MKTLRISEFTRNFSETDPNKAVEVARLVLGVNYENGVRVNLLNEQSQASVHWNYTLLYEFTGRWFSVMCGSVDVPLDKSDLGILGKRFWNTMISINVKQEWMANEKFKSEEFWPWLAARTYKLNLHQEMSKVQKARFESYSNILHQWRNCKIPRRYQDDANFDRACERKIYDKLKDCDIDEKETHFGKSESKVFSLVKESLRDGHSNFEKQRGRVFVKARSAMSKAVCDANVGEGYCDCLKLADKLLQLNGNSREAWLGKILFELPAIALLEQSRHYLHHTASELEEGKRQAQKALDELDEHRRKFIATTSNKIDKSPSDWRYDIYERKTTILKTQPIKEGNDKR
ncbi:hypothetical protein BOTCAL_0115g00030 [Botryotinia calthae]|uniref:Uncharacterized protein n=1 Tax=Botryotinia calthae TaxID=38488 RepID=A0A4Y8D508_9HELO|nr:hypothetical protein BOTCAL_0115g00030 [Botryotinia calthae]